MTFRFASLLILLTCTAAAGPVRDYRVVAELIPETDAIVPGSPLTLCLHLKHDPGWHTYWKNPGLAGVPIKLEWSLPEGFEAGEMQWARPQRVKMAIYNVFGYEDKVTLLIPITVPEDLEPGGKVSLEAEVSWMMCSVSECHPSNVKLAVAIPIAEQAGPHRVGAELAKATRATMPVKNQRWETSASIGEKHATLTLTKKSGTHRDADPEPDDLYFYSDNGLIDSHPEQAVTRVAPGIYKLILPLAEFRPKKVKALTGVLMSKSDPEAKALRIHTPLLRK